MRESNTPTKNIFQAFSAEIEPVKNADNTAKNTPSDENKDKDKNKAEDFFSPLLKK